jgi:hypothetical protein
MIPTRIDVFVSPQSNTKSIMGLKSELDRLSQTQKMTKSVTNFSNAVRASGGFFTYNSSNAHQLQQEELNGNRDTVYNSALSRYREMLNQGETTKNAYLEHLERQLEDNKRYAIEQV